MFITTQKTKLEWQLVRPVGAPHRNSTMQEEGALPEACSLPFLPAQPTPACTMKATCPHTQALFPAPGGLGLHIPAAWAACGVQVQEEGRTQAQGRLGRGFWSPGYRDCAPRDGDWGQVKTKEHPNRVQARVWHVGESDRGKRTGGGSI